MLVAQDRVELIAAVSAVTDRRTRVQPSKRTLVNASEGSALLFLADHQGLDDPYLVGHIAFLCHSASQ